MNSQKGISMYGAGLVTINNEILVTVKYKMIFFFQIFKKSVLDDTKDFFLYYLIKIIRIEFFY